MHATLPRELPVSPAGLGVDSRAQLVPFQPSATEPSEATPLEIVRPVAVHAVDEVHDTPER
jgi:hypothetical protein